MTLFARALVVCAVAAFALSAGLASAQQPEGRISGVVLVGDAGLATEPVTVQLIVLGEGEVQSAQETTTEAGRFAFEVEPDIELSYVVWVVYDGVQYLAPPVLLSRELPTAEVELVVYERTTEPPTLAIERTTALVAELRELDDDTASGRISADERRDGRRALAPRLRAVTEALRDAGLDPRGSA